MLHVRTRHPRARHEAPLSNPQHLCSTVPRSEATIVEVSSRTLWGKQELPTYIEVCHVRLFGVQELPPSIHAPSLCSMLAGGAMTLPTAPNGWATTSFGGKVSLLPVTHSVTIITCLAVISLSCARVAASVFRYPVRRYQGAQAALTCNNSWSHQADELVPRPVTD
eukprot:scaffold132816_cov23-Tisochrysis_lutea.AAC.1